tara:strand:- start:5978 stop:6304 length:327 start_codon:yes stop_codon:yes gene_type:complete
MYWNSLQNLKKIKNVGIDRLKEKSLTGSFIHIYTTESCPHCIIFKKNTLDMLLDKIKGIYGYKLCDVGESSYHLDILQSAGVNQVPTILLFSNGNVKKYTPEEFLTII